MLFRVFQDPGIEPLLTGFADAAEMLRSKTRQTREKEADLAIFFKVEQEQSFCKNHGSMKTRICARQYTATSVAYSKSKSG